MAIQGSYNLDNALYSQAYAYKCWYNYNYGGNTLGISANDIGEITQAWRNELPNWQNTAMDDENAYEIEDDDYSKALDDGYKQGQEKTGYDGGNGGMTARGVVDGAMGLTNALATTIGSKVASKVGTAITGNLVKNTAEKVGTKAAEKAIEKATVEEITKAGTDALGEKAAQATAEEISKAGSQSIGEKAASESTSKVAGKDVSFIVAAPLSLAQGTLYTANKPNKDQKEACDALQDEMVNAQNALGAAQGDMETAADEVITLSDEAAGYNEDANENIEDDKAEFDIYRASYEALMAKVEAGETLSEDEKALLKELIPLMQDLGVSINETSEDTTDAVSEIYDEMGDYQEIYDNSAATIAEVEGLTDFAESFDSATQTLCYVEAGAQALNAASGATAAYKAGSFAMSGGIFTAWAWAFAGMGGAGAAMSGIGAKEQLDWAGQVGNEISLRKDAQDLNADTTDIYDESIDGYEGYMSTVEDMELLIPEDMEVPEEGTDIPDGEDGNTSAATGFGLGGSTSNGQNDSDKKDDDDKKV